HSLYSQLEVQLFAVALLFFFLDGSRCLRSLHSFPTRRSSDLVLSGMFGISSVFFVTSGLLLLSGCVMLFVWYKYEYNNVYSYLRSEEHTSELQSRFDLVCRLLLEKKKRPQHLRTPITT